MFSDEILYGFNPETRLDFEDSCNSRDIITDIHDTSLAKLSKTRGQKCWTRPIAHVSDLPSQTLVYEIIIGCESPQNK